jgi:hypothetical protein
MAQARSRLGKSSVAIRPKREIAGATSFTRSDVLTEGAVTGLHQATTIRVAKAVTCCHAKRRPHPGTSATQGQISVINSLVGIAWLAASALTGLVGGLALGLWLGPARVQMKSQRAKLAAADTQDRRAMERLREAHRELTQQLAATEQRHVRAVEVLSQAHASDLRALEDELRLAREQMHRLLEAGAEAQLISGTAFVATQFGEDH